MSNAHCKETSKHSILPGRQRQYFMHINEEGGYVKSESTPTPLSQWFIFGLCCEVDWKTAAVALVKHPTHDNARIYSSHRITFSWGIAILQASFDNPQTVPL